jgi:hypothetical protein
MPDRDHRFCRSMARPEFAVPAAVAAARSRIDFSAWRQEQRLERLIDRLPRGLQPAVR